MAPSAQAFRVEWLLFLFHYFRAQLQPAEDIARQLVTLSDTLGDPFFVFEAHRASAATLVEQGQFEKTLEHLEQVSALYDTNRRHESLTGQSPRVVADCIAARALWALGFPDAALQRVERALSLAREFSRGESLLIASHYAAHLHLLREEPSDARELAETVIGIAEEYGLPLWHAFGHMTHGAACVAQGAIQPGVDELRRGLAMYERTEAAVWRPYYVGVLAQALARAGRIEEALANITVALATVEATGERWCLAELQRIEGELLIQQAAGDADESAYSGQTASGNRDKSGGVFQTGDGDRSHAACTILGTAGEHEPRPALPSAGQAHRSAANCPGRALLVHGGPRHRGPEVRAGAPERAAPRRARSQLVPSLTHDHRNVTAT